MRAGTLSPRLLRLACGAQLVVAGGCRGSRAASEAPEPDAAAWGQPAPGLVPETVEAPEAVAAAEPRPRRPGTIFRDEVERATGRGPAYLLRQLGPEPYRHEGHFVGWTITQLFPDDPTLCAPACDLAVGDVILGVNGYRMQTPQELSDAFEQVAGWTAIEVHSLRGGNRRVVTYPIVDDAG